MSSDVNDTNTNIKTDQDALFLFIFRIILFRKDQSISPNLEGEGKGEIHQVSIRFPFGFHLARSSDSCFGFENLGNQAYL